MSGIQFIRDLAIVLVVAGGAAWLCRRAHISAVVGYLVAGAIVGPHTPPFALVTDLDRVQTLAQLGLVFLIFSIGLNLNLSRLKRLGISVILATGVSSILILSACRLFGAAAGWTFNEGMFLAAMLMVSSSAIISKVLEELNRVHDPAGQMALGVTVLEDVVAVLMLTLLTSMIRFGGGQSPPLVSTLAGLAAFVVLVAVLSLLVVPKLLHRLTRESQPEIRVLVVAGLLLGLAWVAAEAGYSLALGAFLLGAIVGSTPYKGDVERAFSGVRDLFGAVFFVAVGMLVDFRVMASSWPLVLLITGLALVLRPVACAIGFVAVGKPRQDALQAALCLTPMGEFSFILAQLGVQAGAVAASFYPAAVGASLLTAFTAPVLTRRSEKWTDAWMRREPAFLRNAIGGYQAVLDRLRGRRGGNLLWRLTARRVVQVAIHLLALSALILLAEPLYLRVLARVGRDWLFPSGLPFVYWTCFGLVVLGPLIAVARNITALAMIVAESATTGLPQPQRPRMLVEYALRIAAGILLAAWLLALLPSGSAFLGVAGGVFVVLLGVALVFWRRFVRWHSRLEIELQTQIRRASSATSSSAWLPNLPGAHRDWGLEIDEVTLPGDTAHAGVTVGQLALRPEYGCSIIGIDRQGHAIPNPRADQALFPEDKLLLLGRKADLDRAAAFLGKARAMPGPSGFDELAMETLIVPEESPLAGKPLAELDLIRRFGVQVGGIRRGPSQVIAPSGKESFLAGDELLLLATRDQVKALEAALSPAG